MPFKLLAAVAAFDRQNMVDIYFSLRRMEYFGAFTGSGIVYSIMGWGAEVMESPSAFFIFPAVKTMGSPSGVKRLSVSPSENLLRCVSRARPELPHSST